MARTRTAAPTQKIGAAGVAGLITTIGLWVLRTYAHTDIPADIAGAIVGLIAFVVGYIMPPGDDETVPTSASVTMEHVDMAHVDTKEIE
jgi:hypothetical protein